MKKGLCALAVAMIGAGIAASAYSQTFALGRYITLSKLRQIARMSVFFARRDQELKQCFPFRRIARNGKHRLAIPRVVERTRVCKPHDAAFQRVGQMRLVEC